MVLFGAGCEQPSEVVSSSKLLQFHYEGKGNPLNAGRWNSEIIDPAWPGPKIQLMDPKRWDFEVFCRVISLSILVSRYGRLSKLRQRVWNVLGHELSVEKFRTCSCRRLDTFYLNFICVFDESDWCLLIFLDTRFLSAWAVWIGTSTARLDEPWAVSRDGSLEFSENEGQNPQRTKNIISKSVTSISI